MKYEGDWKRGVGEVRGMRFEGVTSASDGLRQRTKLYALEIIRLSASLPHHNEAVVIGRQLLRSGTSVGAQFREACRAKSDADDISKLSGSMQELDESSYWMELLDECQKFLNQQDYIR